MAHIAIAYIAIACIVSACTVMVHAVVAVINDGVITMAIIVVISIYGYIVRPNLVFSVEWNPVRLLTTSSRTLCTTYDAAWAARHGARPLQLGRLCFELADGHAYRHVYRHVPRHVYGRVYRHL